MWDTARSRRVPLRSALTDLRHTLLLYGDGRPTDEAARLAHWVREHLADVVEAKVLDRRARRLEDWSGRPAASVRRGRATLVLVRPDGVAELIRPGHDAEAVRSRLAEMFSPVLDAASPSR